MSTHEVRNQVPPLAGHDVAADPPLLDALARERAGGASAAAVPAGLHELGLLAGSAGTQELARLANEHPPALRTHDRYGHRIDEVEFHPAWHQLMATAVGRGLHAAPWADDRPGAHARQGRRVLRLGPGRVRSRLPGVHDLRQPCPRCGTSRTSPPGSSRCCARPATTRACGSRRTRPACWPGMAMTEKQGGSDVRAITTSAEPDLAAGDGSYLLTGHKWFCSAPMCDLFLVLARAPEGLTCFLLPRVRPDGSRNGMHLQRLKDKLGNRSNASAEVEYDRALAWPVGEPGRGVATIIDMVSATRLDCVLGSAAAIRQALVAAVHHARHRRAFGLPLDRQPLMRGVLADLALESQAATTLAMRLAGAADRAARGDAAEAGLLRLALPAAKYWVCKRAPAVTAEALECLGGNGYVEESGLPRLYRDAPLNSVWEGSGNVTALDVLRALGRSPGSADLLAAEAGLAAGADPRLDRAAGLLRAELGAMAAGRGGRGRAGPGGEQEWAQFRARRLAGLITVVLQAALLARHAPAAVSDAFCASRLDPAAAGPRAGTGGPGAPFGTLPDGADLAAVLDWSACPEADRAGPGRVG